jgi:hypothetical protein
VLDLREDIPHIAVAVRIHLVLEERHMRFVGVVGAADMPLVVEGMLELLLEVLRVLDHSGIPRPPRSYRRLRRNCNVVQLVSHGFSLITRGETYTLLY